MAFSLLVVVWLYRRDAVSRNSFVETCYTTGSVVHRHIFDIYWLRLTHNLPFLYVVASFISMKLQL
jgi:hypothetical protein